MNVYGQTHIETETKGDTTSYYNNGKFVGYSVDGSYFSLEEKKSVPQYTLEERLIALNDRRIEEYRKPVKDWEEIEAYSKSIVYEFKPLIQEAKTANVLTSKEKLIIDVYVDALGTHGEYLNKKGFESKTLEELKDIFDFDKFVFPNNPSAVIATYSAIANAYYSLAQKEVKGSEAQMNLYRDCAKFAYEVPVEKFEEDEWLRKMGNENKKYLDRMIAVYYSLGKKTEYQKILPTYEAIEKK